MTQSAVPQADPSQDQEVIGAQTALQAAQANLNNARNRYNDAAAKYDATPPASSQDLALGNNPVDQAQKLLQAQADALSRAESDYATAARQLAIANGNAAGRVQSPETKAQLQAQASNYTAQASLAQAQADVVGARSQTDLATAQANLVQAQAGAQKTAAEINTLLPAQANSLNASAAQSIGAGNEANARASLLIPAQAANLSAQTTNLGAQTNLVGAQANLAGAQAGQAQAQTQQIIPAQVKQIMAQAGLSDAQTAQVWAQIQAANNPQQVTQGLDQPYILSRDPQTGKLTSAPNPAYQTKQQQALSGLQSGIDQIQQELANGTISVDQANQYKDLLHKNYQSTLLGTTPYQQQQDAIARQQAQATTAAGLLNQRVSSGTGLAQSLTNSALNIVGNKNFMDPSAIAGLSIFGGANSVPDFINQLGGGSDVYNAASGAVKAGLGPDPASALLTAALGQSPTQQQPSPMPQAAQQPAAAGGPVSSQPYETAAQSAVRNQQNMLNMANGGGGMNQLLLQAALSGLGGQALH